MEQSTSAEKYLKDDLSQARNDSLTDITLISTDGQRFRAHSTILSIRCESFKKLLKVKQSEYKVEYGSGVLENLLQIIYGDKDFFQHALIFKTMKIVKKLKIKVDTDDYAQYLGRRCLNRHNVKEVCKKAISTNDVKLIKAVQVFIYNQETALGYTFPFTAEDGLAAVFNGSATFMNFCKLILKLYKLGTDEKCGWLLDSLEKLLHDESRCEGMHGCAIKLFEYEHLSSQHLGITEEFLRFVGKFIGKHFDTVSSMFMNFYYPERMSGITRNIDFKYEYPLEEFKDLVFEALKEYQEKSNGSVWFSSTNASTGRLKEFFKLDLIRPESKRQMLKETNNEDWKTTSYWRFYGKENYSSSDSDSD